MPGLIRATPPIVPDDGDGLNPPIRRRWRAWLTALAIGLLLLLTLYSLRGIDRSEWQAAASYWNQYAWLFAIAIIVNYLGILCDYGAWRLLYRKFGAALPARSRVPLFFSLYAGQFMPLQSSRLIRPMLVRQLQPAVFARSAGAEAALFYIDLVSLCSVVLMMALFLLVPWAAAPVGLVFMGCCFASAPIIFRLLGFLNQSMPAGFWYSGTAFATAALRTSDALLQGFVLYLLLQPVAPDTAYPAAALYALVAVMLGAGSGLPGGVGATEGIMAWLVGLTAISAAHVMITVAAYRLITFYMQLPLGWLCLLIVRGQISRRRMPADSPHETAEPLLAVSEEVAPHARVMYTGK